MASNSLPTVLTGVAVGDSWGYPYESRSYDELLRSVGTGPDFPPPPLLIVSDDTQLSLAVAYALDGAADQDPATIQTWIVNNFRHWLHDPDMRGYGRTTITAVRALDSGRPWHAATRVGGEACGAVMRTSPCAFLPDNLWQPVSAWQAACTHGGWTAIAASVVATAVLRRLLDGDDMPELLAGAVDFTGDAALTRAAAAWLGEHPAAGDTDRAAGLLRGGMATLRAALERARAALPMFRADPWCADVSDPRFGGRGWLAADVLACALLCVDMLPGEPLHAIRRAVLTGGDSDTLGAVTGMVLGARYGDIWPPDWTRRIEPRYRLWIAETANYRLC